MKWGTVEVYRTPFHCCMILFTRLTVKYFLFDNSSLSNTQINKFI